VYGEKGGLEWKQEDANTLLVKWLDKPTEVHRAGTGYVSSYASHNARTPPVTRRVIWKHLPTCIEISF
jgi:hypothetical protein